ncbi:equilibrative nucleoside transporter 1 isoform X2 [Coccinella septempunctata]|uniref:equilibrative nucleoside transporter 1 isoform X2 n=1 Tax=Coccinella septempunctata TaxID=41139 RepID=UPI001D098D44|nr:equilibrative nucleoside transporter 1 isoform X2 [Coccinella septempunctata]
MTNSRYNERNGSQYAGRGDEASETSRLQQPVKLHPSWEENNLPEDELNFKHLTMDQASLEVHAPRDRWNLIYIVFLVHGIGTLTPWNMFITAEKYFTTYKLSESYIGYVFPYVSNFIQILTFCSQVPNVAFNWLNIFVQIGGGELTTRIVYSIGTVVVCFLVTVFLAMIDTASWPETFFWITMICVVVLNMANGVYQNTVFGMAAKLPGKYTGAIILGNNISGTFVSLASMLTTYVSNDQRIAAIYYFITALFVLFICFDTYFALPLNRYYRHHDLKAKKLALEKQDASGSQERIPYLQIIKKSRVQLYNVFCVLFVTLAVFPSIQSGVQPNDPNFFLKQPYFTQVTCFLTFNIFAMLGSLVATMVQWPKPRFLWIPVTLRLFYIPYYIFTNYQVQGNVRVLPVYFENDLVYWIISMTFAFGSGYLSSLAMMFTPQCAEPKYAATAGMLGGAFLISGIFTGILVSFIWPWAVTHIGY